MLQEKEDLKNKWPGDVKAQNNAFEYIRNDLERYRADIKKWMEVNKNNLNEPAVLRDMQPNIRSFNLDPFIIDVGAKKLKHYYPVYKIDAPTLEKCKADKPQWVAVSFPVETKEDGNQQYELYRAMLEHFNYDYVYNYYFNPEKVKNMPYKPVNEALLNATLDGYRKKSYWQKPTSATAGAANNSLPANVHFMDDFAGDTPGSKPAGWFFSSIGQHAVITTLKNQPGNWVQLGYANEIKPTTLKTPLPQNFTLEYDVATSDFAGRYGGSVILNLDSWSANATQNKTGNSVSVKIEIGAGNENDFNNNNYRGYVNIELNKVPEVNEQNFSKGATYKNELREFTNKKNKVHLVLKINNGELTVMIENKKIVAAKDMKLTYGGDCKDCTIPAGLKFNTISWKNTTNDSDNVKAYISNVKITKD
jgi:hypothetical protein